MQIEYQVDALLLKSSPLPSQTAIFPSHQFEGQCLLHHFSPRGLHVPRQKASRHRCRPKPNYLSKMKIQKQECRMPMNAYLSRRFYKKCFKAYSIYTQLKKTNALLLSRIYSSFGEESEPMEVKATFRQPGNLCPN